MLTRQWTIRLVCQMLLKDLLQKSLRQTAIRTFRMMTRPNSERHYAKMLEACLQDFEIRGVGMAFVFLLSDGLKRPFASSL
jgi:hypothetical protein